MDPSKHRAVDERVRVSTAAVERIEQRNRRMSRVRLVAFVVWLTLISVGLAVFALTVITRENEGRHDALKQEGQILSIAQADSAALQILQEATGPDAQAKNAANLRQAISCIEARIDLDIKGRPMPAGCPSP